MTRCSNCKHHPHPGRDCSIVRVSGPASDGGRPEGEGYDHGARDVTPCDCPGYQSEINGVAV